MDFWHEATVGTLGYRRGGNDGNVSKSRDLRKDDDVAAQGGKIEVFYYLEEPALVINQQKGSLVCFDGGGFIFSKLAGALIVSFSNCFGWFSIYATALKVLLTSRYIFS